MIILGLIFFDIFFKIVFTKHIYLLIPFILLFFLKQNNSAILLFLLFSFLNDLTFFLSIGFTGLILGAILAIILFLSKYIDFNKIPTLIILSSLVVAIFVYSIFYKINIFSFDFLFYIFLINIIWSIFIISIYKIIS